MPAAAERALTDALTAPATPAELAHEAEYVQAFMAVRAPLHDRIFTAAAVGAPAAEVTPPTPLRRHRLRVALAAGLAAVAVTGTAAALTTTLTRDDTPAPSRSSGPLSPGSTPGARTSDTGTQGQASATGAGTLPGVPPGTAPGTTPGATPGTTPGATPGTGTSTAPGTNLGPTSAAGAPPAGSSSASHGPSSAPSTPRPTPSTPSPNPSTGRATPSPEVVAACAAYAASNGRLSPRSREYTLLVAAAGSADTIPAYCAAVLKG